MRRRASRQPINGHSVPRAQPADHCRALVLVDGTAIRKRLKKDYEKALRDLDNSRRLLDQFCQTDQPQFTRWLNSQFGALLTEIRELSQKISADEELIFFVEHEVMFGGGSHARAYKRLMELRENPEPPPPPAADSGEPDGEREHFGAGPETGDADGEDESFEAFFDEVFGAFAAGQRPHDHRGHRPGQRPSFPAPAHTSSRLKDLYRRLVRRLHPDSQREMTAQKTEWWHQAQAAYEAGDAEQLEVILTLCEIGDHGTTAHTSASLLQRITAQLKSSLREIKRQLAARRRDPAWNFSRRSDHDVMAAQMRRALMEDLQGLRNHWRATQAMIAEWKAASERLKQPRRRKHRPQDAGFPF